MDEECIQAIKKLNRWVNSQNFTGWDIYDALNSEKTQKIKNFYIRFLLIQFNKYSPYNFRPYLQIQKNIDLKGITLFSQAYSTLYRVKKDKVWYDNLVHSLEIIRKKSLKKMYGDDCWASHYFPYISIDKSSLSATTPDIIGTSNAIIALINGYAIFKIPEIKEEAISGARFLVQNLFEESENYPYFRYSSLEQTKHSITLNASAQALEALSGIFPYDQNEETLEICQRVSRFLVEQQRDDGSWVYSIYPDGRTKRVQMDFHQGYMIDGLLAFLPYSEEPYRLRTSIEKGARYYQNTLFRGDGTSYYRYPLPYPIDIHNQAQGIITFSKLCSIQMENLQVAKKILKWTLNQMQDEKGYFYYQKWPFFKNKIPYMRWGQAWMMVAMAQYCARVNNV